jgi:UDP-glucose 4-epimerase
VLRYFNAYGPRSTTSEYGSVINKFMSKISKLEAPVITGNGEATRDFVYVKDIARANVMAASSPNSINKTYNVASGTKITVNEVANLIVEILLGSKIVLPFQYIPRAKEDILDSYADVSLIKEELGFEAKYSLEEGLGEYFAKIWPSLPLRWENQDTAKQSMKI